MSTEKPDRTPEDIFAEAVEIIDSAQRAEFLDQACGDDANLRRQVEALLRHDADAGSFLEKRPNELQTRGPEPTRLTDDDDDWESGRHLLEGGG